MYQITRTSQKVLRLLFGLDHATADRRLRSGMTAAFLLLFSSYAFAEEQLGVAVFPGAKYDQAQTVLFRKAMSAKGGAYRTAAPVAEVAAFYKKQGLLFLKIGSSSKKVARFKKVDADVDVVVQSPWQDAMTGATMTDTLILIFQEEEKGTMPDVTT